MGRRISKDAAIWQGILGINEPGATVKGTLPISENIETFAKRINPRKYNFSPRFGAILGALIGYDYGIRDGRGGHITGVSVTSDGFVIGRSTASDGGGAFLGDAADLRSNLTEYFTHLRTSDVTRLRACISPKLGV